MLQVKNKSCLSQFLRDKNGCLSLRELATALILLALITCWIGQQFFGKAVPEFMFYSFASLIGAGCFGYSLERKTTHGPNTEENPPTNSS